MTKKKKTNIKRQVLERFWPEVVAACAEALNVDLTAYTENKQERIVLSFSKCRQLIIKAGRRTGKSFSAAFIIYCLIVLSGMLADTEQDYSPIEIVIAASTASSTHHIWENLHSFLKQHPVTEMVGKTVRNNWTTVHKKKELVFENGTRIRSASCESIKILDDDIRGGAYDLIVVDEYQNIAYKKALDEAMKPALQDADRLNMSMIIGTPDLSGPRFEQLYKQGQDDDSPHIVSFHLQSADNPHKDDVAVAAIEQDMDPDSYAREIKGEDLPRFGRMFADFDPRPGKHVIERPLTDAPIIDGVDFGYRKPVALLMQITETSDVPHVHVFYELAPHNILTDTLVEHIEIVHEAICKGRQPVVIGCDKAGEAKSSKAYSTDMDIMRKSFHQARTKTTGKLVDKGCQVKMLQVLTKAGRLTVDPQCIRLIQALTLAQYNTDTAGQIDAPGWKKEKGHDDPLDALAYALINYGPTAQLITGEPEKETVSKWDQLRRKRLAARIAGW